MPFLNLAFLNVKRPERGERERGGEGSDCSKQRILLKISFYYYYYYFDKRKTNSGWWFCGFSSWKLSSDLCDCVGFRHHHVRVAVFRQVWNLFLPLPSFLPRSVGRSTASTDIVPHLPLISPVVVVVVNSFLFCPDFSTPELFRRRVGDNLCVVPCTLTTPQTVQCLLGSATTVDSSKHRAR